MPQLTQDDEPHVEQLPLELEPLVAAVSPNKDASETSITSISSNPSNIAVIFKPSIKNAMYNHCQLQNKGRVNLSTFLRYPYAKYLPQNPNAFIPLKFFQFF